MCRELCSLLQAVPICIALSISPAKWGIRCWLSPKIVYPERFAGCAMSYTCRILVFTCGASSLTISELVIGEIQSDWFYANLRSEIVKREREN